MEKTELSVRTENVLEKAEEVPKKSFIGLSKKGKKDKDLLKEQLEHLILNE